jgi:hypothetical protein
MNKRLMTLAACAALLTACSPQKPATPTPAAEGAVKYNTDLDMKEFMGHVIDPASFGYWKGSGDEVTTQGVKNLSPTSEEGWEALESSAAVLIEAGNMLQLPGRARAPEADWNKFAQLLTARAVEAKEAAGKHDKDGVFKTGAEIYQVCTACHKEYVIDPMLKAGGRPKGVPLPEWPADVLAKQQAFEAKATATK